MKELKGTEKQIKWAESIRQTWINQINEVIETAQIRVKNNNMPREWLDTAIKESKKPLDLIDTMFTASRFIDARQLNIGNMLQSEISKNYKAPSGWM